MVQVVKAKTAGKKELSSEYIFLSYFNPKRKKLAEENIPRHLDIELLDRCTGGCKFCWNYSTPSGQKVLPRERLFNLIDEAAQLGTVSIEWQGGEPLFYPWLFEASEYAAEKGIECCVFTSGIPLTKQMCKKIVKWGGLQYVGLNIETTNERVFARIHDHPKTLKKKLDNWKSLLDAGFPSSRVFVSTTLTKPVAEAIEETIDYFVDEMKVAHVFLFPYKPQGPTSLTHLEREWEPSLDEVRRAMEYRAKRLSPEWLRIATLDTPHIHCIYKCYINIDGEVAPCNWLTHMSAGNIHEKSFIDIHEPNKEMLHFKTIKIKGKCADCEHNDVCFGCRGNAWRYLGDVEASDPKCWKNPESPQYVWQMDMK